MRGWGLAGVVAAVTTAVAVLVAGVPAVGVPAPAARAAPSVADAVGDSVGHSGPAPPRAAALDFAGVPGLTGTEIHWTRWSRWVVYGGASTLEGQVVTDDGALREAEVELYARRRGADRWRSVGTAVASPETAVFSFRDHEPSATTDYRVVFAGDLVYAASEATRRVPVRRRVRDRMRRVDPTHYSLRGSVAPRYRDRRVRLQRRTCRRCAWSTVATRDTDGRSRWRFRVDAPDRRHRTWYYRAVVPRDAHFARSYSDRVWSIRRG